MGARERRPSVNVVSALDPALRGALTDDAGLRKPPRCAPSANALAAWQMESSYHRSVKIVPSYRARPLFFSAQLLSAKHKYEKRSLGVRQNRLTHFAKRLALF